MATVTTLFMLLSLSMQIISTTKCPEFPKAENVYPEKILQTGIWYPQYRECSDDFGHFKDLKCHQLIISLAEDLEEIQAYLTLKAISAKTNKPSFRVYNTTLNAGSGQFITMRQYDTTEWGPIRASILLTDNVSYFVTVLCAESKSIVGKIYLSVRVVTSCPFMPLIDLKPIHKVLQKHDIGIEFERVDQSNCSCNL